MKKRQRIKYLYKYTTDDSHIIPICVYNLNSHKVYIRTFYKHARPYALSRLSKKIKIGAKEGNYSTCDILKQHAVDLKDDPERLSTKFLQKILGVKCDE